MALLSGEVETPPHLLSDALSVAFRMALLSGEVETRGTAGPGPISSSSSGWLCYPGKLKRGGHRQPHQAHDGSGWLCYPGKLKPVGLSGIFGGLELRFRMALLSGEVETT